MAGPSTPTDNLRVPRPAHAARTRFGGVVPAEWLELADKTVRNVQAAPTEAGAFHRPASKTQRAVILVEGEGVPDLDTFTVQVYRYLHARKPNDRDRRVSSTRIAKIREVAHAASAGPLVIDDLDHYNEPLAVVVSGITLSAGALPISAPNGLSVYLRWV